MNRWKSSRVTGASSKMHVTRMMNVKDIMGGGTDAELIECTWHTVSLIPLLLCLNCYLCRDYLFWCCCYCCQWNFTQPLISRSILSYSDSISEEELVISPHTTLEIKMSTCTHHSFLHCNAILSSLFCLWGNRQIMPRVLWLLKVGAQTPT